MRVIAVRFPNRRDQIAGTGYLFSYKLINSHFSRV
jgi:hypothetical protein